MLSNAPSPLPLSVLFVLRSVFHCLPCRWECAVGKRCLNLGVRTHRAAGVYSTATPVKNTLSWKCSQSVRSKTRRKIRLAAKTSSKNAADDVKDSMMVPGLVRVYLARESTNKGVFNPKQRSALS